ncbi:MAG: HEPN domain-containing protein [Chloroflexi bacterium]|nr:MAG: HEPN domain-containing protein [Chloroflexota bacterium]
MNTPLEAVEAAVLERKKRAIERFLAALLNSDLGDQVARVVLFGSLAEGRARPESDVDLLIFGTGRLAELSEAAADAAFEAALETGESVEPLVYCTDVMHYPHYFAAQALRDGQELYRMDEKALRRAEAEAALGLAQEYLAAAQSSAEQEFYRLAVDAAYNSAELCVKALVLLTGAERPKTHGGVVRLFGKLYVQSGRVSRDVGRRLNVYLELRNKARYDFHARITADDARGALALAQECITLLEETLSRTSEV